MEKYLRVYLITFLILSSISISTIPVTNTQPEDDVSLEERLKEIEISLNELCDEVSNITVTVNGLNDEVHRMEYGILEKIVEIQQTLEDIKDEMVTKEKFDDKLDDIDTRITDWRSIILGVFGITGAIMVASIGIFVYYARK